jgi:hypothetical protein
MMNRSLRIAGNLIFGLNILLLFFLVFEEQLVFPAWLQSFGRMHPLMLHLPIGVVLLAFALGMMRRSFEPGPYQNLLVVVFYAAALLAVFTALMGAVLSGEGGYDEGVMYGHRLSGAMVSVLSAMVIAVHHYWPRRIKLTRGLLTLNLLVLLTAGHLGGTLTHGENYILAPLTDRDQTNVELTDTTTFFDAAILPVFERKCVSCHNEGKSKGGLVLTSLQAATKGGEHGPLWTADHAERSMLLTRIMLPENHKDHMPPSGKAQLSILEAQLIYEWLRRGADTVIAFRAMEPGDSLRKLAESTMGISVGATSRYHFAHANEDVVSELNDPFLTVNKLSLNEPALAATFFISKEYKRSKLENLSKVKEQLVDLNLSRMPVADGDYSLIGRLSNLEKLNLNFTSITADGLKEIISLGNLEVLAVAGTGLNKDALVLLKSMENLREVFIWNTPAMNEVEELRTTLPSVMWNTGYVPDEHEVLKLTPPFLVQEKSILGPNDRVLITHKLPGTIIRYTVDGTDPDSLNGKVFDQPIAINGFTVLKATTCKTGWFCSKLATYTFFSEGMKPDSAALLTSPAKDYRGSGIETLVDQVKGYADNHRDKTWLGYRGNPLSSEFYFSEKPEVSNITVSYCRNTGGFLFPPLKVEVWGGNNVNNLTLLGEVKPEQPKSNQSSLIEAVQVPLKQTTFGIYRVVVYPVPELPEWHTANNKDTKDKRAWVFVDELFFN